MDTRKPRPKKETSKKDPVEESQPGGRESLPDELDRLGAVALAILSRNGSVEPDLGRFLGGAHLGEVLLLFPRNGDPVVLALTAMEREEAARSGLAVLDPERLGIAALQRAGAGPVAIWTRALEGSLEAVGCDRGRVAVAGSGAAGVMVELVHRAAASGIELISGSEIAEGLRRSKNAAEVGEIERVSAFVHRAFLEVARLLVSAGVAADGGLWVGGERLRIGHFRQRVREVFCHAGLTEPKGNLLAPGREGGVPHNAGEDASELRAGESFVVDLFPKGRLFADVTRTFVVGSVPPPVARAHEAVREALALVRREARVGVRGWDLQVAVCEMFRGRGYPEPIGAPGTLSGYVHNLGHGVGYELHEAPSFRNVPGRAGLLLEGDVVTLEPGLYDPAAGGFGMRLEDLVVLDSEGPRCLTPWSCALDPRAFLEEEERR